MKAQNLDKLTADERDAVALLMSLPNFVWPSSYMVEVRLDNPLYNILEGGDGLHRHAGNGSREYAKHYSDQNWAVIHAADEDWAGLPHEEMVAQAQTRL